jgi:hypothetical protein
MNADKSSKAKGNAKETKARKGKPSKTALALEAARNRQELNNLSESMEGLLNDDGTEHQQNIVPRGVITQKV